MPEHIYMEIASQSVTPQQSTKRSIYKNIQSGKSLERINEPKFIKKVYEVT